MFTQIRIGVLALLMAATPVVAQDRAVVVSAFGGGYSQLVSLNGTHLNPGFALGGCVGLELTKAVSLHADLTWTRAIAHGPVPFSGAEVWHSFYGAHLELRAPAERGLVPFWFLGAGAVIVDPGSVGGTPALGFSAVSVYYPNPAEHAWEGAVTKPALTFGGGLFLLRVPNAALEMFFEGKALLFRWDWAGYDRMQVDVTYALGLSYRIPLR